MSKSIILSTISPETINNLSRYSRLSWEQAENNEIFSYVFDKIAEERTEILQHRQELLKTGSSFDDAMAATSIVEADNAEAVATKSKKAVNAEYKEIRKTLMADFGLSSQELYAAYSLGVEKLDYSATGSITLNAGKKSEKIITVKKSFNTAVGEWLENQGVRNADNTNAVRKWVAKRVLPLIGGKEIHKATGYTAWSQKQFENRLLSAIKTAMIYCGLLVENEDHTVSRKSSSAA